MSWADMAKSVFESCVETFRTDGTYYSISTDSHYAVRGVFDGAYISIDVRDGLEYSSTGPALGVSLAQLETVPMIGDDIKIADITYRIQDVRPDGQGAALLILEKK